MKKRPYITLDYNSESPKKPRQKIKINSILDLPYDPSKSDYFKNLFQTIFDALQGAITIDALNAGTYVNYQIWNVKFRAEKPYQNKKIYGQLRFPNDYPQYPPKFYFNKLSNNQFFQHLMIYGDGSLCIPLLQNVWKPTTHPIDILEAIVDIFNNPNWNDYDALANPPMGELFLQMTQNDDMKIKANATQKLNEIYSSQAQLLEDWN